MNTNAIAQTALGLPIYEKHDEIVSAIRQNQVIVIAGETGSGKTTQLPFFCIEAGRGKLGKIGCTQPRRIAATSIAARVAAQMGCEVGAQVGYKIRFAAKESAQTVVKFMTDGILLAEVEHDINFKMYDTIIIDEAHERSLNIDFLLGYLRKLLPKRPDLKLIISSATIDAERFSQSFGGAPIIEVSGRVFPIDVLYRTPRGDDDENEAQGYVEDAVAAVGDLLDTYGPGDMLVFMPTERDIRETCDKLGDLARRRDLAVLPLFSRMASGEQNSIFNPGEKTRVVVCTNIAETSITVPNIRYVVDTGLARILRYAPRLRTNRLPIEPISRASADQRKGRCGRVRDGVCIRLYSEDDFRTREQYTMPEIKRSNLAGVILTMTAHSLGAIEDFPFIESPSKQAIHEGYAQLKELGALDKKKNLTPLGREMSKLPFDPHISRMIVAAQKEGALHEVKIIAAALSIVDPRERPLDKQAEADEMHKKFLHKDSDFLTFLNIWDAFHREWEAVGSHGGMRRYCIENFLSYTRMREWLDVYAQLDGVLKGQKEVENDRARYNASYNATSTSTYKSTSNENSNSVFVDRGSAPVTPPRGYTVGSVNVNVNSNVNSNVNNNVNVNTMGNPTNVNLTNVNANVNQTNAYPTNVNQRNVYHTSVYKADVGANGAPIMRRKVAGDEVDNKNVAAGGGSVVPRRIVRRSDVLAGRVPPPPRPVYNNVPPNNNFAPNNNNVMPNNNVGYNRPPYNNNYGQNRPPYNNNNFAQNNNAGYNRPTHNNNYAQNNSGAYNNNSAYNRPPYNNNFAPNNNYAQNRPSYNNNVMTNNAAPTNNVMQNNNATTNNVAPNNNVMQNRTTTNNKFITHENFAEKYVRKNYDADAVHRSLLTGLLANCACLDKNNKYRAVGGKEIFIFPGSVLAKSKPEWIMCHEIFETTRVFARTVAQIKPQWLEELAAEFCKRTFEAPFFDVHTGYVRATERIMLFGMPLSVKTNSLYSKAEPELASKIFIQEGLVEGQLECYHPFYKHNMEVKEKVKTAEDKLRSKTYYSGDDAIFDFYAERLPNVASINDLNNAIKEAGGDEFLFMTEDDILNADIPDTAEYFPDEVNIGNQNFALRYAFEPGADHDGVTLALPQKALPLVDKDALGWLLPALWPARIKSLLQNLPKATRKLFVPMNESSERLASMLERKDDVSFAEALSKAIKNLYGLTIAPQVLDSESVDAHLDLKLEVRDDDDNIIAQGRSGAVYEKINSIEIGTHQDGVDLSPWNAAFTQFCKSNLTAWPQNDDLEKPIDVGSKDGLPIRGFPALVACAKNPREVDLMYYPTKPKSDVAHRSGVKRLLELALEKDLSWTERDLTFSKNASLALAPFGTVDKFKECLYNMICENILDFDEAPRTLSHFEELVTKARETARGIGLRVITAFEDFVTLYGENSAKLTSLSKKLPADISEELSEKLENFLQNILTNEIHIDILLQYPRYVKTFAAMLEKAAHDPYKYRSKKAEAEKFKSIYDNLHTKIVADEFEHVHLRNLKTLQLMICEYEVSLFAQHIKTLFPISEKKIENFVSGV